MSWRTNTLAFIHEQRLKNPDMKHAELKRHCSKNYPFYARSGAAYKGFLKAMRETFGRKTVNKQQQDMFTELTHD